ncbi:hypothetical protein, partial [Sansalvadorimonas verongulae]|uniref:hypothetical protein n=1 Tax=Sansalvadorimonas verongulae TaxID=2172824 RepID=UPI0018AD1ABC
TLEWLVQREGERLRTLKRTTETLDFEYNRSRKVADDGSGGWQGVTGTVDYATGAFSIQVTEDYSYSSYSAVRHDDHFHTTTTTVTKTETFEGSGLIVKAQSNSLSHVAHVETVSSPEMTVDLLPN